MNLLVQKFGGTSVATEEARTHCFRHIRTALDAGYKVVVVVSAMGREGDPYATDSLLKLAPALSPREKDLLISTGEIISASVFSSHLFEAEHIQSKVLTGGQAGIRTDATHTDATILDLKPERLLFELSEVDVVIVAGFQGMSNQGEVTTLGRGGSDTSATALGSAIHASWVDIFTDVEGIMTADPKIVKDAAILQQTTYNEVCHFASQGAKVIHPRAVETAMKGGVPIRVRSTFSHTLGTLVSTSVLCNRLLTGITQTSDIAQLKIFTSIKKPATAQSEVFQALEHQNISVDFISIHPDHTAFTVSLNDLPEAKKILDSLSHPYEVHESCAKISLVGAGMAGVPGVMSKTVRTLAEKEIPILQSADSHTTIWVLVNKEHMRIAVRSLHAAFLLHIPEGNAVLR